MDAERLAAPLRALSEMASRRGTLGLLAGAAFASLLALGAPSAAAKKKPKKKPKRKPGSKRTSPPPRTSSPPPSPRPGTVLATYDVTLAGVVDSRSFQRTGVLQLVQPLPSSGTQNGANPIDVCLVSGNPWTAPSVGALTFGSNSACFGGGAQIDMAVVSRPTAQQIFVEPDPNVAAICVNLYNSSSGVTAFVYAPYNGGMLLEVRSGGQTIVGAIDTNGLGSCRTPAGSRYQAQISGTRR